MKKCTIKDVAAEANVSIATVSRVINKPEGVSPELVKIVQSSMDKLNYRPNYMAQSLRKSETKTIGLILPNLSDPFFGGIADSIIKNAAALGLNVVTLISRTEGNEYDEYSTLKKLSDYPIDGLIFCSVALVDQSMFNSLFPNLPIVICSRRNLVEGLTHIFFDHQKGGYLATKHLIEMGHRKISLFVGLFGNKFKSHLDLDPYLEDNKLAGPYSGIEKYIGARRALSEMGVEFHPELLEFIDLDSPYLSGYDAMQRLVSNTVDFDAVFSSNDLSATGALHMLTKQKISVPDDVSIIGYDDGLISKCSQPQLSTVVQDTQKLGTECVKALSKIIKGETVDNVLIDVKLTVRQSSCKNLSAQTQ